jgi:aminomethyltransferase
VIAPSEARRIEAGIFNYGSDIRIEDTPLHVTGLERYVEWDQEADFIGRERLEEIRDGDLLDRKLVGIEIGGEPMVAEGALNDFWPLFKGDARLGRITAGAWSPRLERNIGYAWVPIRWEEPGSAFEAETQRGRVDVTVAPLPFVDPAKDIPKS